MTRNHHPNLSSTDPRWMAAVVLVWRGLAGTAGLATLGLLTAGRWVWRRFA